MSENRPVPPSAHRLPGSWRNAGSWLLDYRYALVAQARAAVSRGLPADFAEGDRAPVLILPGVYESWPFLRPLIDALHADGHPVHVVSPLRRNRRPVALSAEVVADQLTRLDLHGVVIVAHSKGGLIGKYLMTQLDPDGRVDRMIAISTPFSGSRYARYLLLPSLRALAGTDPALRSLGADDRLNARIVSIFGRFDPHIPEGSSLPGAENVRIDTGGHFRILGHPDTVRRVLAAASAAGDGPAA